MHRQGWVPGISSLICSDHFLETDLVRTTQFTRLTKDAIPTRFKEIPEHLKKTNKERVPAKRKRTESYNETPAATPTSPSPPTNCLDHNYCIRDSPKTTKIQMTIQMNEMGKKLEEKQKIIVSLRKKLRTTQRKSQRYKHKFKSLTNLIKELKNKKLLTSSGENMLNQTFSGVPLALFKRIMSKSESKFKKSKSKSKSKSSVKLCDKGRKYPDILIAFALTLQFYSTKAYEYVRNTFELSLPCQSEIRRRYAKIPADPGFTEPAFVELRKKVEEAEKANKKVVCALMLDEMAIRKHGSFDGERIRGYVDLGNDVDDDSLPHAKDALVFMVVCVNSSWKVPCAYYFIDGLGGSERANLIKIC
ncbi:unnamed protein product, partial [Meganyctiphanes norvegica]